MRAPVLSAKLEIRLALDEMEQEQEAAEQEAAEQENIITLHDIYVYETSSDLFEEESVLEDDFNDFDYDFDDYFGDCYYDYYWDDVDYAN